MTPAAYRKLRKSVGTQAEVAAALGVHVQTISGRERGLYGQIGREAEYALRWLAQAKAPPP